MLFWRKKRAAEELQERKRIPMHPSTELIADVTEYLGVHLSPKTQRPHVDFLVKGGSSSSGGRCLMTPQAEEGYYVRGCTALLDTIGDTMERIMTAQKYAREEDRPEKTLFVITTDGMENSSRRYRIENVKEMIEERKQNGWEFLFLGANMDAIEVAGRFGIAPERAVRYECDSQGTRLNYDVIGQVVQKVCSAPAAQMSRMLGGDWKKEIEADYLKRHK